MTNSDTDLLMLLADQEESVARLYETLGVVLPEMSEFWGRFADEEHRHAKLFGSIRELVQAGTVDLKKDRFRPAAVEQVIAYLNKRTEEVLRYGTTARRALSLAVDIEHSLLETAGFTALEADSPKVRKLIESIDQHTRKHIGRLEKRLREESGS